jgi:hypothetical protein
MTTSNSDKPAKKAGLGGIFGNVRQTKKLKDAQAEQAGGWKRTLSLTCPTCGAAQEQSAAEDLSCVYCGEPIVPPKTAADEGGDDG